jgi:hypothetical protein
MVKLSIGIDPGKDGFVTVNNDMIGTYYHYEMPKMGKEIDIKELNRIFEEDIYPDSKDKIKVHAVLEDVHSIPGSSAVSNFQFGRTVGMIQALLVANSIPFTLIQPKEWQKEMWKGVSVQKKPGTKRTDTKLMSKMAARRLFPDMDFKRNDRCSVDDHNKIDSLLMCEYCKRKII